MVRFLRESCKNFPLPSNEKYDELSSPKCIIRLPHSFQRSHYHASSRNVNYKSFSAFLLCWNENRQKTKNTEIRNLKKWKMEKKMRKGWHLYRAFQIMPLNNSYISMNFIFFLRLIQFHVGTITFLSILRNNIDCLPPHSKIMVSILKPFSFFSNHSGAGQYPSQGNTLTRVLSSTGIVYGKI